MNLFVFIASVIGIFGVFMSGVNFANDRRFMHIAVAIGCAFSATLQLALALL